MRGKVTREAALEDLYKSLTTMVRRARDVGDDLHPGLVRVGGREVLPPTRARMGHSKTQRTLGLPNYRTGPTTKYVS